MTFREESLQKMYKFQSYIDQIREDWDEFTHLNYLIHRKRDQIDSATLLLVGILDGLIALVGLAAWVMGIVMFYEPNTLPTVLANFYERYLSWSALPWVCLSVAGMHYVISYILENKKKKRLQKELMDLYQKKDEVVSIIRKHYSEYQDPPVDSYDADPWTLDLIIRYLENCGNENCTIKMATEVADRHYEWVR